MRTRKVTFLRNFEISVVKQVSYKKTEPEAWFYNEQQISLNLALTLNKDTSNYDSQRVHEISNGNWLINKTTQYSTSDRLDKIKAKDWEFLVYELKKLKVTPGEAYRIVQRKKAIPILGFSGR